MNANSRQFVAIFLFIIFFFNMYGQDEEIAIKTEMIDFGPHSKDILNKNEQQQLVTSGTVHLLTKGEDVKRYKLTKVLDRDSNDVNKIDKGQSQEAKQLKDIKDLTTTLKEYLKKNDTEQSISVGTVYLLGKGENVTRYKLIKVRCKDKYVPDGSFNVDSVTINMYDGYIVEIQVFAGNDVFINGFPIEMSHSGIRQGVYLESQDKYYIKFSEILQYRSILPYTPDEANFTLNKEYPSYQFSKGVGLNNVFDLRIYSDALGFLGGKANGIVQTEASVKQLFQGRNGFDGGIVGGYYVKFNLSASKFDSKLGFTDSTNFTSTSLLQKSWLNTDLSINIFNGWLNKRALNTYFMDIGMGVSLSDLAKSSDTTTIASPYLFLTGGVDLIPSDNVGVGFTSRLMWTFSSNPDIPIQVGGQLFLKSTFGIFWNPVGDETGRIFGRISYVMDLPNLKESFLQVQLGYTLQISTLIK